MLPARVSSIPYNLDALLDWSKLSPSLAPAAANSGRRARASAAAKKPPGSHPTPTKTPTKTPKPIIVKATKLREPKLWETAIELPWRLVLSPTAIARWRHTTKARTLDGWSELWHTRLVAGANVTDDGGPLRAVWNYDVQGRPAKPTLNSSTLPKDDALDPKPFRTGLTTLDRYQICRLSSDFSISSRADIPAKRLWLSARGGFLESDAFWDPPFSTHLDMVEWKQTTTLGRDHYVKVVRKGYLFPYGHRAVQITITERRFEQVKGHTVATSRQHKFIVVRQPDKNYAAGHTFGVANDSRDLPFRTLHIVTLRTPDISLPTAFAAGNQGTFAIKVPTSSGDQPFQFHFIGTDWIGRQIAFTAPAVFVDQDSGLTPDKAKDVRKAYNALSLDDPLRVAQVGGQTVAFGTPHKQGDTDVVLNTIAFSSTEGEGGHTFDDYGKNDQPAFYPALGQASVRFAAAEQAQGGKPLDKTPLVSYDTTYVGGGFGGAANKGNVFLRVEPSTVPAVQFGDNGGAVMSPNLGVSGLSRSLGPISGNPDVIQGGTFDPQEFFKGLKARILGGVLLTELILKQTFDGDEVGPDKALKLKYETSSTELTTRLHWTPDINLNNPIIVKRDGKPFSFELDASVKTDLQDPKQSTFTAVGNLRNFEVHLMSTDEADAFLAIIFNRLTFKAAKGQKSHTTVDIEDVQFLGVLKFVEKLQEIINFGTSGGPEIDVTPTGVKAELDVALPDIAVGVLALTNINIVLIFNLPFDGSPARFRFSFSKREDPFALSVAIFGGTGFFGLAIGTDGVEKIEAAFEFGAMCSINLGVASGSVHLVAGIYFAYGTNDKGKETCTLSGYVKLGGSLSILGIITLSLEFDLSLTYQGPDPSIVTGEATMSVSVSILFFSFSVSVTARKQFGGGQNGTTSLTGHAHGSVKASPKALPAPPPPTFLDQLPQQSDWTSYCNAFAAA
jgi:hypothetical protein